MFTTLRRPSIDRKLLGLVTGLLLATVTVFSWMAYAQVERVELAAAGERLQSASALIRGMLEASTAGRRTLLLRLANEAAVRDFLRLGVGRNAALAVLDAAAHTPDGGPARVQLRDARGQIVLESVSGDVLHGSGWIERTIQQGAGAVTPGGVRLSPIWSSGATAYTETITAVSPPNATDTAATKAGSPSGIPIGYVSDVRHIVGRNVETVRGLIGEKAVLLIGQPGEGGWTDLERPTPPAPPRLRAGQALIFDSSAWGAGVGAATAIRGTPWVLWVHQPRSLILASTRRLIVDLAILALVLLVIGAILASVVARRITAPIVRLTGAAEQVAAEDTAPGTPNDTPLDEIERLAEAFTLMSVRVHESHDALAASERRFRSLIENASDPIAIIDRGGVIHYASPAYGHVLGHQPDELLDRQIVDCASPEDGPGLGEALRALGERPGVTIALRARFRHHDGSWRLLAGSATNLLAERSIAGIVLNWRDVTEQTALETQLRHAQKMEAVGRLAGGIAHDLNNILTAITAFSQFAASRLPEDSEAREDVGQVELAAQRATALTKQLLAFSRQQVLQPRPFDLNAAVTQMEGMLRRLIRADVSLRARLAPSIGQVMADPAQLEQVVLNLVLNARDAMPNGGSIVIETADVELSEDYAHHHPEVQAGPYVMLSVADSGFGMDAETRSRIFEPFYTTKAIGSGTGLGLATVYGIVKQSGGSIWVYSEVGQGSVFKVFLPRYDGAPVTSAEEPSSPLHEVQTATVLLVEDDAGVQHVARRSLESAGYVVHCASDGREALAVLERLAAGVDLVITDLVMPDIGGKELALRLSERAPEARILFMSGYTAEAMNRQSVLSRNEAFLEKPFTPRALVDKVRLVLRGDGKAPRFAAAGLERSAS